MKKQNRQHQLQRQKLSRKTVIIICAASLFCLAGGLTVFFHLSHTDRIKAENINVIIEPEQVFTTEKSIAAPVLIPRPAATPSTIHVKRVKAITETLTTTTQQ